VVRRVEFDHALAMAARARGIQIVDGDPVVSLRIDRQDGVEVRTRAGHYRSRVLVGADGVGSIVRRTLGLGSGRWRAQALEVDTEPVDGDLARDLLFFDLSDRRLPGYYWDFPTRVGGRSLVSRGVYALRTGDADPEIQDVLARELGARGLDLGGYRKKRFAERGFELHVPFARPRVLLVGEAAGIDPVTGEGIAQAIEYGAFAGRYLAEKIGRADLEFEDWGTRLARSSVGRDLLTRLRGLHLFHGPATRSNVERYLETTPEFVRIGLQHFGGLPWSSTSAVRAAVRAAGFGLRHFASLALGR
jgi:flavin-dependent dehydrogenase